MAIVAPRRLNLRWDRRWVRWQAAELGSEHGAGGAIIVE